MPWVQSVTVLKNFKRYLYFFFWYQYLWYRYFFPFISTKYFRYRYLLSVSNIYDTIPIFFKYQRCMTPVSIPSNISKSIETDTATLCITLPWTEPICCDRLYLWAIPDPLTISFLSHCRKILDVMTHKILNVLYSAKYSMSSEPWILARKMKVCLASYISLLWKIFLLWSRGININVNG